MKPFLVFYFESYQQAGGWDDFIGDFYTLQEAKDHAAKYTKSPSLFGHCTTIVDTSGEQPVVEDL